MTVNTTLLPKVVKREFHAKQGLRLLCPKIGQLHWLKLREPGSVIFALVLNVNGDLCDVIPGSKDAMQAGPDDIILPRNVMGDFVMLSPGGYVTIPVDSLGVGFARLDSDVFDKVIEAIALSIEGRLENCGFETGFPYLNDSDARIDFHKKMINQFMEAQKQVCGIDRQVIMPDWIYYDIALAAQSTAEPKSVVYAIEGEEGTCSVVMTDANTDVLVLVCDGHGNPVCNFDGACLVNEERKVVGVIEHGMAKLLKAKIGRELLPFLLKDDKKVHFKKA